MSLDGFIRVHVDRRHEPAGLVGADGKKSQPRRAEAVANPREERAEAGVGGEVDEPNGGFQHVTAPQGAIAIE